MDAGVREVALQGDQGTCGLGCYARGEGIGRADSFAIFVECDAGAPAGSVAERVFAVEGGDLLRPVGAEADGKKGDDI